jgi:hypothetical protein
MGRSSGRSRADALPLKHRIVVASAGKWWNPPTVRARRRGLSDEAACKPGTGYYAPVVAYGEYSYAITVRRPDGSAEATQTHTDQRAIRKGDVLDIPLFGEIKITEVVEEAGVGRAGRAYAERVSR